MGETRHNETDEVVARTTPAETGPPEVGAETSPVDAGYGPPRPGIPVVAEALGYVGGALALGAIIALLVRFWAVLGPYGHVGIGLLLAAAGLIGGFTLERVEGDAAERLSQFLLFAGVAGVGIAVGFAVRWVASVYLPPGAPAGKLITDSMNEWAWFAGAAAVAVSGGLVWWRRHSVLQHLAFGGGVAAAALLALPLMPVEGYAWGAGAVLIVVALVWGALSLRELLPPRVVGLVLSALGIVGGIEMMVISAEPMLVWAMWLGAVASAALIWVGSRLEELGVLGVGTVALMVFAAQIVGELLGFGAGTAIGLIAIGFVLLGVGVRLMLRMTPGASQKMRIASEVAGYLGVALAVAGAGILVSSYWDELGVAGHIAVPAVGAAVAFGCAFLLHREESHSAGRLSQVLLAIGVVATGFTAAMIAQPIAENVFGVFEPDPFVMTPQIDYANSWTVLVGTVVAAIAGGIAWWLRRGSLTQVAFMAALMSVVMGTMNFMPPDDNTSVLVLGSALLALGTIWVVLGALEKILPVRTALVMGSLSTFLGLQMLLRSGGEGGFNEWAVALGIAYGVAGIVASIYLKRGTLLGFGAVYVVIFSLIEVLQRFGGRASAPVMLLVMGVVFIAVAVVVARVAPSIRREPKTPRKPRGSKVPVVRA